MKKRKFLIGAAIVAGLMLTAKIGRSIYWNSLSNEQKVERVTERMSRWLALSADQKTRVGQLNLQLIAEKGDLRFLHPHRGGHCQKEGDAPDPSVQKWRDGMKQILNDEQAKKLRL